MQLQADSEAQSERFCRRVAEQEVVYFLSRRGSPITCESNEYFMGEDDPCSVMLFFSHTAYAKRAIQKHFPRCKIGEIKLFDFMYRWLPGMTGDGVIAGPDWNSELAGKEWVPFDLRLKIEEKMCPELVKAHELEYMRLSRTE